MGARLFSLLERVHGHLGWLALVLLLHPVVSVARTRVVTPFALRTARAGAALLLAPSALGWALYPTYRSRVKPALYAAEPRVALLFETKEHLAVMSVLLAVSGAAVLSAGGGTGAGRRTGAALLALAVGCGLGAGALGTVVATVAQPGW